MFREQTILLGDLLWITEINDAHDGYITVGPYKVIGFEINSDSIRGIDHVLVEGASHTHHQTENVYISKAQAEQNTEKENKRMIRRRDFQVKLKKQQEHCAMPPPVVS